jgi:2',3'-cyclic-nucleotide 2'-phosphodiesterase (5'-nucleotidase family)
MLAGDFLSSSVASTVFKGEQMIAALNAAGLDVATLGNHEFDFGTDLLIQRMHEAKWQWVVSNVIDTNTGKPIGGAAPYLIRTFGAIKVGIIGLCLNTQAFPRDKLTHVRLLNPLDAAAANLRTLKNDKVDVIIALTHLAFEEDRALIRRFPEIDLIVGGHEHYPITVTENRTLISKAGSEARWVARIDVNKRAGGPVERFYELIPITSALPEEPGTAAVVASYESKLGTELDAVVGTTRVPLDADTIRLRARETNLGDFIADALRTEADADVAILNSGMIRGDRVYPEGPLTRRTILAIHPFGNVLCKVAVPGRVILEALNSGVSKLPATAGQFPQVSGLTFRVNAAAAVGARISDVTVAGNPLDLEKTYTVALPDFMLQGGDGYSMFSGHRLLVGPEAGGLVVEAIEKYIAAKKEIAPAVERRIIVE